MGSSKIYLSCRACEKEFFVYKSREDTAKFCSRACADSVPRKKASIRCSECGKLFHMKPSAVKKAVWGHFCSTQCTKRARPSKLRGENNPNWKGRLFDHDGYRLYTPSANKDLGFGRIKLHHALAFLHLGILKLPSGMHIHHKDCDVLNNDPSNLQIITISDHKWLHKQYGSAGLAAVCRGELDISLAASWSDDESRATRLLFDNLLTQGAMSRYLSEKLTKNPDLGEMTCVRPIRVDFVVADSLVLAHDAAPMSLEASNGRD